MPRYYLFRDVKNWISYEKNYGDHFPWTWWECIEPFVVQRSKIKEFWLIETVGIVTVSSSKNDEYPRSDWLPILSSDWSICPNSSSENFSWSFIFTIVPASNSSCLGTVFKLIRMPLIANQRARINLKTDLCSGSSFSTRGEIFLLIWSIDKYAGFNSWLYADPDNCKNFEGFSLVHQSKCTQ